MAKVIAVSNAFPKYYYSQKDISGLLAAMWPEHREVIERLATTSGVEQRHLVQPLEAFPEMGGFGARSQVYQRESLEMLKTAITSLREKMPFEWKDVGALFSTTITGVSVPSLEARMMNIFPQIPTDVTRMPLFGLGCLGGIGTLNRAADWLRLHPTKLAVVMAVEACSLTFQLKDVSMANLIATHLFGDGSAAVLMVGDKHPLAGRSGLRVLDHKASFYPNTERVMGWEMVNNGFQIILSGNVPEMVTKNVAQDLAKFLPQPGPSLDDIRFMVSHPGGPKVLKAIEQVMGGKPLTGHSWESLKDNGNMSSVSVLDVLRRTLEQDHKAQGLGLGVAMGPAFNAEFTLFEAT